MAVPHGKLFNSQIREDTQEASLPPAALPACLREDQVPVLSTTLAQSNVFVAHMPPLHHADAPFVVKYS